MQGLEEIDSLNPNELSENPLSEILHFISKYCIGCGNVKEGIECKICTLAIEFDEKCTNCLKTSKNCSCNFEYICASCNNIRLESDLKSCIKCFGYIKDFACERCKRVVPKDWQICESCIPDRKEEENLRRKIQLNSFQAKNLIRCLYCDRRMVFNKDMVCRDCKLFEKKCENCRDFMIGIKCESCSMLKIPEVIDYEFIDLEDEDLEKKLVQNQMWSCFSCGLLNDFKVLFCERCNHSKDYSFQDKFFCEYCQNHSNDKLCKKCFRNSRCSKCHKNNYQTQNLYCIRCKNITKNKFCQECKRFLLFFEVLCFNCI